MTDGAGEGDSGGMVVPGAQVTYVRGEDGTWWAHADIHLTAAAASLSDLKAQMRRALRDIFGIDIPITEITQQSPKRV